MCLIDQSTPMCLPATPAKAFVMPATQIDFPTCQTATFPNGHVSSQRCLSKSQATPPGRHVCTHCRGPYHDCDVLRHASKNGWKPPTACVIKLYIVTLVAEAITMFIAIGPLPCVLRIKNQVNTTKTIQSRQRKYSDLNFIPCPLQTRVLVKDFRCEFCYPARTTIDPTNVCNRTSSGPRYGQLDNTPSMTRGFRVPRFLDLCVAPA